MARAYLRSYVDTPATTVTAVVVTNCLNGAQESAVDIAEQRFMPIPDVVADEVIAKGDIMWCCGGFMIDEPLLAPYIGERVGTEDSIIGLPLEVTLRLLRAAGLPKDVRT